MWARPSGNLTLALLLHTRFILCVHNMKETCSAVLLSTPFCRLSFFPNIMHNIRYAPMFSHGENKWGEGDEITWGGRKRAKMDAIDSHVGRSIGRNTSLDLQNRVECDISKLPSRIAVLILKIQDSYYGRISCKMRPHTVFRIALPTFPLKVSARGNSRAVYF